MLRASAAKTTATSRAAAPRTHVSRAWASERAMASSPANIAKGGSPSSTITPTASDTPIRRERRSTSVMSAIAGEPCTACN